MGPSGFVMVPAMPLARNGKVGRRAWLALREEGAQRDEYLARRNEVEQALCDVWQQVLNRSPIGVTDNFFSLGGDSILSIQMVSRANRAGIRITIRQTFEYPTIERLASQVQRVVRKERPQGPSEGASPLLPVQREFFEVDQTARHHYNQAALLYVPAGFHFSMLKSIVTALYSRHDALRLRFTRAEGGGKAVYDPLPSAISAGRSLPQSLPLHPLHFHFH